MTALTWDQVGERRFEVGVDRGVLFLPDGSAVPWNGITGIEEATSQEVKPYYLDGVKFLEMHIPGDFSATLKAFTYPDEFEELIGIKTVHPGLRIHEQAPKPFSLCYRTKVGNDLDGVDHGYKIHIVYNVFASPSSVAFNTLNDQLQPTEFSWTLSGVPSRMTGFRPAVHISIESNDVWGPQLEDIENLLYGTDLVDPQLPPLEEFVNTFYTEGALLVVDNGDGTWTAYDAGDNYIVDDGDGDPTTFEIDNADVVYDDPDTYELSDTREE